MDKINSEENVTKLWKCYEDGRAYHASIKLSEKLPMFVRFYEGDQWPAPTSNTKNLPRPVINIIKMIVRNKRSAILSTPVKLVYETEDLSVDVEKFNNFADYIQKEYDQEAIDKKAIDSAVKKGTYVYHYYWDTEAEGKEGIKEGGVRCELVDPLNIFFADPTKTDEQKQKWILISSREDVDSVKAKCDKDVDESLIRPDTYNDSYGVIEQQGDNLVTVLTRYFRQDGEVYCEKATKTVVINKPFAISPDIDGAKNQLGIEDAPNNTLPDNHEKKTLNPKTAKATLYPIVVGNYELRENCIYGIGEIEGLIPNQKAINFNVAMMLLNAQQVAWGKYVVAPGALRGQVINNQPGQVLTDYTNTGNGIKKLSEQVMQSQPLQLVESIAQLTRSVTGSSEIMTGESVGANMSGAAIAQIQSQAQMPVETLKETFWDVKKRQGMVLAQFFKLYYVQKEFVYKEAVKASVDGTDAEKEMSVLDTFDSSEFANAKMSVVVETTRGTRSSTAGDINFLDMLLSKGLISLRTYINAYPKDALSNKSELLKGVEKEESSQLSQLQLKLREYEEQVTQYANALDAQNKALENVSSIINENKRLQQQLAEVFAEGQKRIRQANLQIEAGNAEIAEIKKDATDFSNFILGVMQAQEKSKNE